MFLEFFLLVGDDSLPPVGILHETDNDGDEHDPVYKIDQKKWEDEAKPERVARSPAAAEQRGEAKPLQLPN